MKMKTISASSSFPFFTSVVASVTLLLVLVLTCSSVVGYQVDAGGRRRNPPPPPPVLPPPPPPPFQFHGMYLLVIQWPRSICNVRTTVCDNQWPSTLPRAFTIHGMWPEIIPQLREKEECPRRWDGRMIVAHKDLTAELSKKWVNAKFKYDKQKARSMDRTQQIDQANQGFWKHEWVRHGGCSPLEQANYFRKAMDLYDEYDLTTLVSNLTKKIGPSSWTVNQSRITEVIEETWKAGSYIMCNLDANNKLQIQEIHLKFKFLDPEGKDVQIQPKFRRDSNNCSDVNKVEVQTVNIPK